MWSQQINADLIDFEADFFFFFSSGKWNFTSKLFLTPSSFLSPSIQSIPLNIHPHVAMTISITTTSTTCCHDNEVTDRKRKSVKQLQDVDAAQSGGRKKCKKINTFRTSHNATWPSSEASLPGACLLHRPSALRYRSSKLRLRRTPVTSSWRHVDYCREVDGASL